MSHWLTPLSAALVLDKQLKLTLTSKLNVKANPTQLLATLVLGKQLKLTLTSNPNVKAMPKLTPS